jgi:hypothetical protein
MPEVTPNASLKPTGNGRPRCLRGVIVASALSAVARGLAQALAKIDSFLLIQVMV